MLRKLYSTIILTRALLTIKFTITIQCKVSDGHVRLTNRQPSSCMYVCVCMCVCVCVCVCACLPTDPNITPCNYITFELRSSNSDGFMDTVYR